MFVSSACVGLYMKTCYPDEAKKSPVPCFPKGRGIRSCYHLMFPKRSHAPAHGVLIIKDPGISNGCQFRHSLLAFRRNIRFPLSVCSSGMYSEKEVRAPLIHRQLSVRSRSFPYLFPSSLFSIIYRLFNAAIRRIRNCKSNSYAHYRKVLPLCQDRHALFF